MTVDSEVQSPLAKKKTPAKARWTPVAAPKCVACEKSVFEAEKLVADGVCFHKSCFRCQHCSKVLTLGNYASLSGKMYCKPHFKQLFATKGNYADAFGVADPKKSWRADADGSSDASANVRSLKHKFGGDVFSSPSAAASTKCPCCAKTAYAAESYDVDGSKYHKGCFKCVTCGVSLSMETFVSQGANLYCKRDVPVSASRGVMSKELIDAMAAQKLASKAATITPLDEETKAKAWEKAKRDAEEVNEATEAAATPSAPPAVLEKAKKMDELADVRRAEAEAEARAWERARAEAKASFKAKALESAAREVPSTPTEPVLSPNAAAAANEKEKDARIAAESDAKARVEAEILAAARAKTLAEAEAARAAAEATAAKAKADAEVMKARAAAELAAAAGVEVEAKTKAEQKVAWSEVRVAAAKDKVEEEEAQRKKAKEAKAVADAEAKAVTDAEAKAIADAEAKAIADAEAKAAAEIAEAEAAKAMVSEKIGTPPSSAEKEKEKENPAKLVMSPLKTTERVLTPRRAGLSAAAPLSPTLHNAVYNTPSP